MDLNAVKRQLESVQKLASSAKEQNAIFETLLQEAVKGAPEEDKPIIEKVRIMSIKAVALAKEGKSEEAQNLIKQFEYGS